MTNVNNGYSTLICAYHDETFRSIDRWLPCKEGDVFFFFFDNEGDVFMMAIGVEAGNRIEITSNI